MARQSMPLVWSRAQLEIDVDRSISEFKERRRRCQWVVAMSSLNASVGVR